ncbi:probable G-protein coupled receptor 139 [Stegostoma tigrinum]|uniref:probable G-protein coupled receptor 139 n=1 Tax=Stegostoma tigrinum TaxID=3053191 RepID=UPI00202B0B16|nr:probable G-protein coupled receptor 139 [Stegostoma tigrinum]
MDQKLRIVCNITATTKSFSAAFYYLSTSYNQLPAKYRIEYVLQVIQAGYYPILAVVGVPVNVLTMIILCRKMCGLSNCITRYLLAMAAADLLVVIIDLILRHIPIVYLEQFTFIKSVPLCNIHAVLLYAATDCSVWYTVAFTFDRFMAICCQNLKIKFCTKKTATMILTTVTVLSCSKNITWYFILTGWYRLWNEPWFCEVTDNVQFSHFWGSIEFLHYILTPGIPFVLILLLNALTIRHIVVTNRARKRLHVHNVGARNKDVEMDSRRKSIILLFFISANFILLWAVLMVYSTWDRLWELGYRVLFLDYFVMELGFMLQLLSCSTNTCIYVMTQAKFRNQFKQFLRYPFTAILQLIE